MMQPTVTQTELDIILVDLDQRIGDYDNKIARLSQIVSKLHSVPSPVEKELINNTSVNGSLSRISFLSEEINIRNVQLNSLVQKLEELI